MKISATPLPISEDRHPRNARVGAGGIILAFMLAASLPAAAQTKDKEPEKPVTDDTVTVGDVAGTPLNDLNITRDEIPPLLIQARQDPYNNKDMKKCGQISAAVGQLDAILGDDLDIAGEKSNAVNAGRVAKWAVSRFIPFRGLIREVSGAKAHERKVRDAIIGGMMRRAFLKGIGQQKGCRYPGRPAKPEEAEAHRQHKAAEQRAQERREDIEKRARKQKRGKNSDGGQPSVSPPANQPVS